jgi:hypothetical protein
MTDQINSQRLEEFKIQVALGYPPLLRYNPVSHKTVQTEFKIPNKF